MLGFVRSAISASSKPTGARVAVKSARSAPRKLTQVIKRQNCTSRSADLVVPGSKAHWKLFAQECRPRVHHNEDYSSEKILTLNDLEYNREAATVNGRLRHLVNIDASYEEARQVAQEAVDSGVKLDMQSFIYLSTLYKPQIKRDWEAFRVAVTAGVDQFMADFIPDSSAVVAFFKEVEDSADQALLDGIVSLIRERRPKLDVECLEALAAAHERVGSNGKPVIDQLHKEYLIDTPTYDTYIRIHTL